MWDPVGSFLKYHSRFVEEYPEVESTSKNGQVFMRGGSITHVCAHRESWVHVISLMKRRTAFPPVSRSCSFKTSLCVHQFHLLTDNKNLCLNTSFPFSCTKCLICYL